MTIELEDKHLAKCCRCGEHLGEIVQSRLCSLDRSEEIEIVTCPKCGTRNVATVFVRVEFMYMSELKQRKPRKS